MVMDPVANQLALKSDKTFSLIHRYVNNGVYTVNGYGKG